MMMIVANENADYKISALPILPTQELASFATAYTTILSSTGSHVCIKQGCRTTFRVYEARTRIFEQSQQHQLKGNKQLCGAEEACWAHNPKVRGSKPRGAITFAFGCCVCCLA